MQVLSGSLKAGEWHVGRGWLLGPGGRREFHADNVAAIRHLGAATAKQYGGALRASIGSGAVIGAFNPLLGAAAAVGGAAISTRGRSGLLIEVEFSGGATFVAAITQAEYTDLAKAAATPLASYNRFDKFVMGHSSPEPAYAGGPQRLYSFMFHCEARTYRAEIFDGSFEWDQPQPSTGKRRPKVTKMKCPMTDVLSVSVEPRGVQQSWLRIKAVRGDLVFAVSEYDGRIALNTLLPLLQHPSVIMRASEQHPDSDSHGDASKANVRHELPLSPESDSLLATLEELRRSGLFDDEEFARKKAEVLARGSAACEQDKL